MRILNLWVVSQIKYDIGVKGCVPIIHFRKQYSVCSILKVHIVLFVPIELILYALKKDVKFAHVQN